MKKFTISVAAIALVAFAAGSASAQCEFNATAKGKGGKFSLVRKFAECTSTQHPSTNTTTASGLPVCADPVPKERGTGPETSYQFIDGKGQCTLQISTKINKACEEIEDPENPGNSLGLPDGACSVIGVKVKCKGIVQSDGSSPINANDDAGWKLATLTRASLNDSDAGDVTVFDFAAQFDFNDPDDGKLELESSSAISLEGSLGAEAAALPTCAVYELVEVTVLDPTGQPFATLGSSTRSKDADGSSND